MPDRSAAPAAGTSHTDKGMAMTSNEPISAMTNEELHVEYLRLANTGFRGDEHRFELVCQIARTRCLDISTWADEAFAEWEAAQR